MSDVGDRPRPRLSGRRDVDGLARVADRAGGPEEARTRRDAGEPSAEGSRSGGEHGGGDGGDDPCAADGDGGAAASEQPRGREADADG